MRCCFPIPAMTTLRANGASFPGALLNASGSAIFVVDPSGTVVISNYMVQKHLGLFPGSLMSTSLPDFWPTVHRVLEERRQLRDLPVQAGDASFLARLAPINFKTETIGVLCVMEDRTELEKTTRKMISYQELSQELDAIIASSDDGLWICDGQGTILRINAASERSEHDARRRCRRPQHRRAGCRRTDRPFGDPQGIEERPAGESAAAYPLGKETDADRQPGV